MRNLRSFFRDWRRQSLGALVVSLSGLLALSPAGSCLRAKSVDLLFALRGRVPTSSAGFNTNVVVVFLDDSPTGDWQPYSQLLSRLAEWRAKAVVFDVIFANELWNQTIGDFEHVVVTNLASRSAPKILFASESTTNWDNGVPIPRAGPVLPTISDWATQFASNVAIGLAELYLDSSDGKVRSYSGSIKFGRGALAVATDALVKNDSLAQTTGPGDFIINYYGPPGTVTHYQSRDILASPDRFKTQFQDKVVFVGEGAAMAARIDASDRFYTPFTRRLTNTSSGVEIHATAYANLDSHNRIRAGLGLSEGLLVLVIGAVCGLSFVKLTPARAAVTAVGCATLVILTSFLLFKYAYGFLPWLAIVAVQLPLSVAVAFLPIKSAFISYRGAKGKGREVAFLVTTGLERLGVDVYLDLKETQSGLLQDGLLPEVENRKNFVLIVTNELLSLSEPNPSEKNCDWVGEEIARAQKTGKTVLPVYVDAVKEQVSALANSGTWPVYRAIYTDHHFSLGSVLQEDFQAMYTTARHDIDVREIARRLRRGLRRDWGKRPSAYSSANCRDS